MLYTQLRSFHAVAAEGSFTAAGGALRIGQPTITRQVKELEEHFGVELFHRRGRKVHLTRTGQAVFEITRRLFSLELEARDVLNSAGGFHSGRLQIGAVGPYDVTEMLARFHEHYPKLSLSVRIANSQELLKGLLDFSTDIAVLAQMESDRRFHTLLYSETPLVVFVNKDHPWATRTSVHLNELAGQKLILREAGSTTRRTLEAALAQGGVTIQPVMDIGSREAIWWAVVQGLGIGVVSEAAYVPHARLKKLRLLDTDVNVCAHVVCLAERCEAPLIKAFLKVATELAHIRQTLSSLPQSQQTGVDTRLTL